MTIFDIEPSLHGLAFIAEGCDRPTGDVYSGVASGGSYDMGLAANLPFWAIQFFNIYLSPVCGSAHLRTGTWPFWTKPIVQFWVLQNPLKNWTKPNLTIPTIMPSICLSFTPDAGVCQWIFQSEPMHKAWCCSAFKTSWNCQIICWWTFLDIQVWQ